MSHSRWLITGAAGFIGSHLIDFLLTHNIEILGIDNFSSGSTANVERLQNKHQKNWSCLHADITDADTMQTILHDYQANVVVHLAAKVSVPDSIKNPIETHETNVTGFFNVLQSAKRSGAKRFIYMSSSAVYGEQTVFPIPEIASLSPLSLYGLSKTIDEQYAHLYASADFQCIGLRLFNIFGPWQNTDSPYAAVIAKWCAQLQQGKPITIFGDGSSTRDYCHVANVVQAIDALAQVSLPHSSRIYNIGSGTATRLQELAELLLALTNKISLYYNMRRGVAAIFNILMPI